MSWLAPIRRATGRLVDAWTSFWFTPQDALSLGVCRVLVGSMMVYSHLVWGLNLDGFFGPDGWQSTEAIHTFFAEDWLPSLWWYVPAEHLQSVHLVCLLPLVMFVLGVWTPLSSILALAITISNSNRAPLANYGMDQILTMLGLYLVIGGSGARFSLDAWWWRRRRTPRGRAAAPPMATSRARLATRLIQVHYCVIYFFAGISKLQGDAWWNGEAIWMAFANQEYQSLDMTWLAHYPWITQLATHATVLWELSFAFVVWNRTLRPIVLLIGVAMHAGIGLCMGMITFGLIAVFGYLAFVPPKAMQRVIDSVVERFLRSVPEHTSHQEFVHSSPNDNVAVSADDGEADQRDVVRIAICDPDWKHRQFAHYLARRGFSPFMTVNPQRIWSHVEQQELAGVILFVDRMDRDEYSMLLNDLTLSPISGLPTVIASQHQNRIDCASTLTSRNPNLRTVLLPAACRTLRIAIQDVLQGANREIRLEASRNGHAAGASPADATSSTTTHLSGPRR